MFRNRNQSILPSTGTRIVLGQKGFDNRQSERILARSGSLPGEGRVYDPIGLGNFVDLEKNKFTASLNKSFKSNLLSRLLDVDLPAKITLGGKLGSLWLDGLRIDPIAKATLSVRLLDLGASDSRQTGFLRFKASARTNGKTDHGFEIDRKVSVLNMPNTTFYGNVTYKTNNREKGVWKSTSSFGIHHDFKFSGLRFAGRLGMTPEGNTVYDLRL